MGYETTIFTIFEKGEGVLRLLPNFVPRRFGKAGKRLRLHPDDYYALGTERGSFKERWFSSTISASNGEDAPSDEGMSYVLGIDVNQDKYLFKDVVNVLGAQLIGKELMETYHTWPMFAKFFDYSTPLFHHHHATEVFGKLSKPEAYYFPVQLNNHTGQFPVTYFGFDPDVSKEQVRERLLEFETSDNKITELSRGYRIELGTGWYIPAGIVHAPGSVLTYEPQWNSDVNAVFENIVDGEVFPRNFLTDNCPEDQKEDIDYILSQMDWDKNIDPHFKKTYFRPALVCDSVEGKFVEKWITYDNDYFSAKELTIEPGQTVTIKDSAAYGCVIIQGHGTFGVHKAEAAIMLRYGKPSADEFFVSESAAKQGIDITNNSESEPMVILKHFGPNNKR